MIKTKLIDVLSSQQEQELRDLPLVCDPRDIAELIGVGPQLAYSSCREYLETEGKSGFPCRRVGRRILCSKLEALRWLGADVTDVGDVIPLHGAEARSS